MDKILLQHDVWLDKFVNSVHPLLYSMENFHKMLFYIGAVLTVLQGTQEEKSKQDRYFI